MYSYFLHFAKGGSFTNRCCHFWSGQAGSFLFVREIHA